MSTLINKTKEIITELEKQGKTELVDYKLLEKINRLNEETRRNYIIKSHRSSMEAEKVVIYQNYK